MIVLHELGGYLWVLVALVIVVAAVLALIWRHSARRGRMDVRGLVAMIEREGDSLLGAELKAPGRRDVTFRFVIRDEAEWTARLGYPQQGTAAYTARRVGPHEVILATPDGSHYGTTIGGPGILLPSGIKVSFRDTRQLMRRGRRSAISPRNYRDVPVACAPPGSAATWSGKAPPAEPPSVTC